MKYIVKYTDYKHNKIDYLEFIGGVLGLRWRYNVDKEKAKIFNKKELDEFITEIQPNSYIRYVREIVHVEEES